jgi:hypothetical protein
MVLKNAAFLSISFHPRKKIFTPCCRLLSLANQPKERPLLCPKNKIQFSKRSRAWLETIFQTPRNATRGTPEKTQGQPLTSATRQPCRQPRARTALEESRFPSGATYTPRFAAIRMHSRGINEHPITKGSCRVKRLDIHGPVQAQAPACRNWRHVLSVAGLPALREVQEVPDDKKAPEIGAFFIAWILPRLLPPKHPGVLLGLFQVA